MKPPPLLLALWLFSSVVGILHGAPFPKDLAVSLQLPDHATLGNRIEGKFVIQNKGTQPLSIGLYDELHVQVLDDKGQPLPRVETGPVVMDFMPHPTVLKAGESAAKTFYLDDHVHLLGPGAYLVSAGSALDQQSDDPYPVAKAKIEIHSPTPKYAATRAHALCAKQASPEKTSDAGDALLRLRDPVYLAPLRKEAEAGHPEACFGIASLAGTAPNEVLLRLTASPNPQVAKAAAMALLRRLPLPKGERWRGTAGFPPDTPEAIQKAWSEKLDIPLLELAVKIFQQAAEANKPASPAKPQSENPADYFNLSSTNPASIAAEMILARGTPAQVPALMAATDRALEVYLDPRPDIYGADDEWPEPLPELIDAIDALRHRGWVIQARDTVSSPELVRQGGLLALLRQLADAKIPKPQDKRWEEDLVAASRDDSLVIRENVWWALPRPFGDDWEPRLIAALDSVDWGIVIAACEAAGDSGRKSLILPLAQVVESVHASPDGTTPCALVRNAANDAAYKLGGGVVLWEAWANVLSEKGSLHEALSHLCLGTIDLPAETGTDSSNGLKRAQRYLLRDAWREFLQKNHDRLERGERVPRNDPSITPALTGESFGEGPLITIRFADGTEWPKADTSQTPSGVPGLPN